MTMFIWNKLITKNINIAPIVSADAIYVIAADLYLPCETKHNIPETYTKLQLICNHILCWVAYSVCAYLQYSVM